MIIFDISNEFLQELDKTRQFLKKGGSYSEFNLKKQRDEVFRFHLEQDISDVSNNEGKYELISNDIEFWQNLSKNRH